MQGHDAACNLQQGRTRKKNQNIRITRKIEQKEKKNRRQRKKEFNKKG